MRKLENIDLLKAFGDRGYPADYILARLRGRRTHLITEWRPYFPSGSEGRIVSDRYGSVISEYRPEAIQERLLGEYRWVYSLMNGALRMAFAPFFLYVELRTVFICLRFAKGKESGKVEKILSASLLAEGVARILRSIQNLQETAAELERVFTALSKRFEGLGNIFADSGLQGFEKAMSTMFLEYAVHSKLHPAMKDFFTAIIDSRNILSLYKYILLNGAAAPPFISGGRLDEDRFNAMSGKKEVGDIFTVCRKLAGVEAEPANIEISLYKMVTRRLKKMAADPLSAGLILDYLWRCSLEAANLGIILYGREVDRGTIEEELVQ